MSHDHEPAPRLSARLWRHESTQALHLLQNHTLGEIETGACDSLLDAAEAPAGRSMRSRHVTAIADESSTRRRTVRDMAFWKRRS